jgi:hypothetical protein
MRSAKFAMSFNPAVIGAAFAASLLLPLTVTAQQRGFSLGVDLGVMQPELGSRESDFWRNIGRFHAGPTAGLSMDYGWSALGVSGQVNTARTSVGDRSATGFGLSGSLHWRLPVNPSGWSPDLEAGYTRQSLGGVSATQSEIRTDFLDQNGIGGNPSQPERTTMTGNGFRFAVAAERELAPYVSLRMFAGADLISFGTVTYMHEDFTLHGADRSTLLRAGLGLRFRPRGGPSGAR